MKQNKERTRADTKTQPLGYGMWALQIVGCTAPTKHTAWAAFPLLLFAQWSAAGQLVGCHHGYQQVGLAPVGANSCLRSVRSVPSSGHVRDCSVLILLRYCSSAHA